MRLRPLLATLLAAYTSMASAQTEDQMRIGLPWELLSLNEFAFTAIETDGANLLLAATEDVAPILAEFASFQPAQGLSVSICGYDFPNFQVTPETARGKLVIPLGDAATAGSAVAVMAGQIPCDAFEVTPEPDSPAGSLLPPLVGDIFVGLTIRSPSDSYDVPPGDILASSLSFDTTSGRHSMNLTFGSNTAQWIATNTAAHVGEMFQLLICGEVINEPVIQAAISGRSIVITGLPDREASQRELAQVMGEAPCP